MGISERRARERERRRQDIVDAAWAVAAEGGWPAFSVERVAARAELGRATVYGYFESLESLIEAMAEEALEVLGDRVAKADGLAEALDVPLRFSQQDPAAFALLFQDKAADPRPAFSTERITEARREARQIIGALHRLASRSRASLPADAEEARAFLAGVAMAGVAVPELRQNTPLRRRWQDFCLAIGLSTPPEPADAKPAPDASKPQDPSTRE
ncbi:MAG: helix-turn-helix domain-containing protein [Minicystis sp.]